MDTYLTTADVDANRCDGIVGDVSSFVPWSSFSGEACVVAPTEVQEASIGAFLLGTS